MRQSQLNYLRITRRLAIAGMLTGVLTACEPITMTMMGVGANAGMSHTLGGIIYKTFTASHHTVKRASIRALNRMDIEIIGSNKNKEGETVIRAKTREREIEIVLEPLTKKVTRMRTIATDGLFLDSATATEIVAQTERVLVGG